MFSKSKNSPKSVSTVATGAKHTPFSILGGDVTVRGNIDASIDLHIDGTVEGDISCAALVQGTDSRIKGHIIAKSARISGVVDGSIAADELFVEGSARVTGDVSYQAITIAKGGQIEGKLTHLDQTTQGDLKLVKS